MRRLILLLIFALLMVGVVSAAPYSGYPAFSNNDGRLSLSGTSLTASDSIVYSTGYYSINAGAWVPFSFTGTGYLGGTAWLDSSASASLPSFGSGEHYVVMFSCTKGATTWDCHDMRWQLLVLGESSNPDPTPTPSPQPSGSYCGDTKCEGIETCSLCRIDCGICPGSGRTNPNFNSRSHCGDGICDTTEYCSVCAADCNSCPEIECPCDDGFECVNNLCLQRPTGSGQRYFVATNGNDGASGSITSPWATWGKAFNAMGPGDVIYIRGGVYNLQGNGLVIDRKSGTASNRITISNYPGERPVLDFGNANANVDGGAIYGIKFKVVSYYTIRGLEIRNLWQRSSGDGITGIQVGRSDDIVLENMVVHDIGGNCYNLGDHNVRVYNSDAYNCVDYITSAKPGNDGTGFGIGSLTDASATVYYEGCRAWNNGDQGFSSGSIGYYEYEDCWSMNNGVLEGAGHGFKMGWIRTYSGNLNRLYTNNIAAYNWAQGFDTNDQGNEGGALNVFSNFAYHNGERGQGYGFRLFDSSSSAQQEREKRVYRNNIAYQDRSGGVGLLSSADYTHDHNSWDGGVTLNDADFESLDISQLYLPRKPDGSLPDITFGKPVSGSDLITQGVYVR